MLGRTYCSLFAVLLMTATEAFQSWTPPITDADACCSLDRRQLISQALFTAGYNISHGVVCIHGRCSTMDDYEDEARPYKTLLFQSLFDSLSSNKSNEIPVVVEVGMGTFPNAPYYANLLQTSSLNGLDIIGLDPNDSMKQYA
eukprot:scaffold21439_cov64-Cyclotella_meneghiniana.AAC.2